MAEEININRLERINDPQAAIRVALDGLQADIWTAMPGIVESYDAEKQLAKIQVAIKAQFQAQDGSWSDVAISVLPDVLVQWPGGGGATLTFPLKKGDEGILVFAARCIDSWWDQGGVQGQAELRMHNLSDGMFIPGLRSKPRKLDPAPSTDKVQLRSDDGADYVELDAAGHVVNIKATTINITGNLNLDGDMHGTGAVIAGFGGADQVGLQTHKHPGNNQPPTPGT